MCCLLKRGQSRVLSLKILRQEASCGTSTLRSMKRVVVLGSTGSIGTQALDVIHSHPDQFEVAGLVAGSNVKVLEGQMDRFKVKHGALFCPNTSTNLPTGMDAICEIASLDCADVVIVSVAGVIGLKPTIAAINAGKDIALASKEVLVAAGELVMPLINSKKVTLTPIDSEHSAVFQCIQGIQRNQLLEVILTASGGPFLGKAKKDIESVTVESALKHPTWTMGGKITIDSATLMNKALETIEAKWLFDIPMESVSAVVHPQSVIHSMIKLTDGSVLAQMGWPNMKLPILYALSYPERMANDLKPWNPIDTPNLSFEPIDESVFPSLSLARAAMKLGGTAPCAFNAANEEAVALFLKRKIPFLKIFDLVADTIYATSPEIVSLENILAVDKAAREEVRRRSNV